jgi:hypothetical protein
MPIAPSRRALAPALVAACAVLAVGLSGCPRRPGPMPGPAPEATDASSAHPDSSSFEGIVRVAEEPKEHSGKRFLGAWIERDGGERWVIDYSYETPYHELRDRRVRVDGETWLPEGQAVLAKHFRVRSMVPIGKDPSAPLVRIGARRTVRGRFEMKTFPKDTKLEGESMRVFVDEAGTTHYLAHLPSGPPPMGVPVTLDAHDVEPSPYIQRVGGPYLWVREIDSSGK